MDTDGILFGFFGALLICFAVLGITFVSADFRYYGDIYKQCKEQSFIQNKTTRITCKVE